MKILLLQTDIAWCDPKTNSVNNQNLIEKTLKETEEQSIDLILLPEMFSTGFCVEPQGVAERDNFSLQWMQQIAKRYDCAVVGSVATEITDSISSGESDDTVEAIESTKAIEGRVVNSKYYNRQFFVYPDGSYVHYDKRHLFSYGGEHNFYSSGNQRVIVEWRGWRLLLQTCYDLRFPIFSRNRIIDTPSGENKPHYEYDAMIYLASWPESRISAWDILLRARAIENQAYVIGLNRVGVVASSVYSGHSAVIDYKGRVIANCSLSGEVNAIVTEIDKTELEKFRTKFPTIIDDQDNIIANRQI